MNKKIYNHDVNISSLVITALILLFSASYNKDDGIVNFIIEFTVLAFVYFGVFWTIIMFTKDNINDYVNGNDGKFAKPYVICILIIIFIALYKINPKI